MPIALTEHTLTPRRAAGNGAQHGVAFTEARLSKPPSDTLLAYDIIPQLNRELLQFTQYIQIDLAHLIMLVRQDIVPVDVARPILRELLSLRQGGVDNLEIDPTKGTLLLQIEAALVARLGEGIAGRLHTARSRIDQGATARRLYKRDAMLDVMVSIQSFRSIILNVARRNTDVTILYHTHMQQAQPGNFAHYLLAFADRLLDDFERCKGAFGRANRNPLGGVGLSGTSWPIDRHATTKLLGFDETIANSKLVREAFYAAEIATSLSFVMATLNDLATDLHVWCSNEFDTIRLDDSFCSTSSIFPQKRNPVALEVIRASAGLAVHWGAAALTTFRGPGTGDQAVKSVPQLDQAFPTTRNMLELAGGVIETLKVNHSRVEELLAKTWSTSSNVADELVRLSGLSFREAHHVVARLVRIADEEGISRAAVTPDLLVRASKQTIGHAVKLSNQELLRALDPVEFVHTRTSYGAVGKSAIKDLIAGCERDLRSDEQWLVGKLDQIQSGADCLAAAVKEVLLS